MSITGANFEQHPSNTVGDILNFVIYYSSLWRHQFSNKHLNISETREDIPK